MLIIIIKPINVKDFYAVGASAKEMRRQAGFLWGFWEGVRSKIEDPSIRGNVDKMRGPV
jgi:hypothetical protein